MKKIIALVLIGGLLFWWFRDPTVSVSSHDVSFGYLVKYAGGAGSGDTLPMLVALHGNGDTAKNFYATALDKYSVPVRIILIKGPFARGRGHAWPWSAADFIKYGAATNEAISILAAKYPTTGKPVLLGFSGGAMMAYYQAVNHGDSYSFIFPVSGQLTNAHLGDKSVNVGAKVFPYHGKSDNVLSFGGGKAAASLLKAKGVFVRFTEFDGGHLGIFTTMKAAITQAVEEKIVMLE